MNLYHCMIELRQDAGHLIVRIENPNGNNGASTMFRPRSMSERATTLGGHTVVEQQAGATRVIVDIPL